MGMKQSWKRALMDIGPRKKVTVLHQLFWFTFRKKISMDSVIFSAMISDNYCKKKIPSGP